MLQIRSKPSKKVVFIVVGKPGTLDKIAGTKSTDECVCVYNTMSRTSLFSDIDEIHNVILNDAQRNKERLIVLEQLIEIVKDGDYSEETKNGLLSNYTKERDQLRASIHYVYAMEQCEILHGHKHGLVKTSLVQGATDQHLCLSKTQRINKSKKGWLRRDV